MARFVKMLGGVLIDRGVTAADVAAAQTEAQVYPLVIVLYTFLATILTPSLVNTSFAGMVARQEMV